MKHRGTTIENIEGYWKESHDPNSPHPLPVPQDQPWKGQDKFLDSLSEVESNAHVVRYRGFSICRVCKKSNGNAEYSLHGWRWPAGFRHYIECHNVEPSPKFKEMVFGHE